MSDNMKYRYILPKGGSRPHNNTSNNKTESNGKSITLCKVCGDKVSGYHYGAYTCRSCREFFRRMLIRPEDQTILVCYTNGKCMETISVINRNKCQHCRFEKCKEIGMKKEASRRGRPSNKRAEMIQQTVLPSESQQSSVGFATAHLSITSITGTPRSYTDHDNYRNSNSTSILNNSSCESFSGGLESPSGDSGSESRAYSSSATSNQHLPAEGDENQSLKATLVPTDMPPADPLVDCRDGDRYIPNPSSSLTQQQETEAEEPLDLSMKKVC